MKKNISCLLIFVANLIFFTIANAEIKQEKTATIPFFQDINAFTELPVDFDIPNDKFLACMIINSEEGAYLKYQGKEFHFNSSVDYFQFVNEAAPVQSDFPGDLTIFTKKTAHFVIHVEKLVHNHHIWGDSDSPVYVNCSYQQPL